MSKNLRGDLLNTTIVRRKPSQMFSEVDGEVIMLSIQNGEYYSLNQTGSQIWNNLDSPISISNLVIRLASEFDVSEYECKKDIEPFLIELVDSGIVEIVNEQD